MLLRFEVKGRDAGGAAKGHLAFSEVQRGDPELQPQVGFLQAPWVLGGVVEDEELLWCLRVREGGK